MDAIRAKIILIQTQKYWISLFSDPQQLKLIDAKQKNITATSVLLRPPADCGGQNIFNEVEEKAARGSNNFFSLLDKGLMKKKRLSNAMVAKYFSIALK